MPMLRSLGFATLAAVAGAEVSLPEFMLSSSSLTERRQLRVGRGAADANICFGTNSLILTTEAGTLSDDIQSKVNCAKGGCSGSDVGQNHGYGDNLDCGKRIQAPAGDIIQLRFTHMTLEAGKSCPSPGCDTVTVYDGPGPTSPVLGKFSGYTLPPVVKSTGNSLYVRFQTDKGNFGLKYDKVTSDPGFYADWHFVKKMGVTVHPGGTGICPADDVITTAHGVLHDDTVGNVDCNKLLHDNIPSNDCGRVANAGYRDNLNCFTTLRAGKGENIQFTFTQMNLEGPGQKPGCMPCTDPRGCDFVAIYDGKDEKAPLLGTFSGHHLGWNKGENYLPSVTSSGQDMHVVFRTDTHNCGIDSSEDPGWIANWDFISNGVNICSPNAGALRAPRGVLHDDQVGHVQCGSVGAKCGHLDAKGGADINGYSDDLDCGVRLHAPRGQTINVHFTQMNIEGLGNGLCAGNVGNIPKIDCTHGGDYVAIYDGANNKGKLIAKVSGDITDDRIHADTFTSSKNNMYIEFVTDKGNYGLTGTKGDPGFWMEWQHVKGGSKCLDFSEIKNRGIVGHNNEQFNSKTVKECEALCCARDWCRSFDFVPQGTTDRGVCALADVDISTNAATNTKWGGSVFERKHKAIIPKIEGKNECAAELSRKGDHINKVCCPKGGCKHGPPTRCSVECDTVWTPFSKKCSTWVSRTLGPNFDMLTKLCERMEYGKYKDGSNHGRCGNGDWAQYLRELHPACCGHGGDVGTPQSPYCKTKPDANGLSLPMLNGQPFCTAQCARMFDNAFQECHPRFQKMGVLPDMKRFLATCQGMGGHRRMQAKQDTTPGFMAAVVKSAKQEQSFA